MIPKPLLAPITAAELANPASHAQAAPEPYDPRRRQLLDALASLGARPVKALPRAATEQTTAPDLDPEPIPSRFSLPPR